VNCWFDNRKIILGSAVAIIVFSSLFGLGIWATKEVKAKHRLGASGLAKNVETRFRDFVVHGYDGPGWIWNRFDYPILVEQVTVLRGQGRPDTLLTEDIELLPGMSVPRPIGRETAFLIFRIGSGERVCHGIAIPTQDGKPKP